MPATYPYQQQRRPTANFRTSNGPNGYNESASYTGIPVQVQQAPELLSDATVMRRQNLGILPRGPSPQFAASPMGQQRFPGMAPMTSGPASPAGPAPYSGNVGALGGYAAPGAAAAPTSPSMGKIEYGRLKDQHAILLKRYQAMAETNADEAQKLLPQITAIEGRMFPENNAVPGGHGMGDLHTQQSSQSPQMPFESRPAPIDTSTPEYKQRLSGLYRGASGGLNAQRTQLENAPAPAMPPQQKAQLTPVQNDGTSQTSRNDASAQAYRNQAVIQRQMDQRNQPAPDDRAGALAQNARAIQNVEGRQAQFGTGDYNLNQPPLTPDQMAQRSLQPGVRPTAQPAQAAATTQPGQKLNDQQIAAYIQLAGGDLNKAKELARAHGHTVQ